MLGAAMHVQSGTVVHVHNGTAMHVHGGITVYVHTGTMWVHCCPCVVCFVLLVCTAIILMELQHKQVLS